MNDLFAPVVALQPPNAEVLAGPAQVSLRMARSITVTDDDERQLAIDEIRDVKAKVASLEDKRTALTVPLNKVLQGINNLFRPPREALEEAERLLKHAVTTYDDAQARILAEQRRKAEEAAAAERARLAAEARRIEDEAAEKRMKAEEEAAALAAAGRTEEAEKARETAAADEQRALDQADAVQTSALVLTTPPRMEAPARAAGVSSRKALEFEVVDKLALVKHVAAHPDLLNILAPDMVKLRALVNALGETAVIPGVRIGARSTLTVRKAADKAA